MLSASPEGTLRAGTPRSTKSSRLWISKAVERNTIPEALPGGEGQRELLQHRVLLRGTARLLVGRSSGLFGDQCIRVKGLELHCVGASGYCQVDQLVRHGDVAVVIHAGLSDDEAGMSGTNLTTGDRHERGVGRHGHPPGFRNRALA